MQINENAVVGTVVTTIVVRDLDINTVTGGNFLSNFTVEISEGDAGTNFFKVQRTKEDIFDVLVASDLNVDRADASCTNDTYWLRPLTFRATDRDGSFTDLGFRVLVTDLNDNFPSWSAQIGVGCCNVAYHCSWHNILKQRFRVRVLGGPNWEVVIQICDGSNIETVEVSVIV